VIIEEFITDTNSFQNSPTNQEPPSTQRGESTPESEPTVAKVSRKFIAERIKHSRDVRPKLRTLGISEAEVSTFLEQYEPMVPAKILESYLVLPKLLEKSLSGYEPYWLCFNETDHVNYSAIKGLVVFHTDPESKLKQRVNILHASVTAEEELNDFLKEVVEYIWSNVNCQEIRVGISNIDKVGEKLVPYEPLKEAYQKLQFRWKTLTNDENGNRILVLGINRPTNKPFLNPRYTH
jgi:hypothetical protein